MAAHGKVIVVSLKNHFSNISGDAGGTFICPKGMALTNRTPCIPYGEEIYDTILTPTHGWIPFRQYNIPSRDFGKHPQEVGCAAAIEDLAYAARAGPAFATNNDGSPSGAPPNTTVTWEGQHVVSLAAFMMAMEAGSYFSSGLHWGDDGNAVWWLVNPQHTQCFSHLSFNNFIP